MSGEPIASRLAAAGVPLDATRDLFESDPGPISCFSVPGGDAALDLWHRLRKLVAELGHYPVLLRDEKSELDKLAEFNEQPPAATLEIAAGIDGTGWFDARVADEPDLYEHIDAGTWQPAQPFAQFTIPFQVLAPTKPFAKLEVALVPTTTAWETMAYLHHGGWNECPAPEEHVAVHRYWHERYGAEIVGVAFDIVEMRVQRPPSDRDAAMALAREHYIYTASDIVEQGVGTLSALGAGLMNGSSWFFWWD